jgi:hypothetical protein
LVEGNSAVLHLRAIDCGRKAPTTVVH